MKTANKPVIMEEFGVTSDQQNTYTTWYSNVISSGLTGDLIWCVLRCVGRARHRLTDVCRQAGSTLSGQQTPNDGYAVRGSLSI
jgi:mannan endo-1,4-beta-mannosidase